MSQKLCFLHKIHIIKLYLHYSYFDLLACYFILFLQIHLRNPVRIVTVRHILCMSVNISFTMFLLITYELNISPTFDSVILEYFHIIIKLVSHLQSILNCYISLRL